MRRAAAEMGRRPGEATAPRARAAVRGPHGAAAERPAGARLRTALPKGLAALLAAAAHSLGQAASGV